MKDYILDFTIPQGPTGPTGPQGIPGNDGLDGATGPIGPTPRLFNSSLLFFKW